MTKGLLPCELGLAKKVLEDKKIPLIVLLASVSREGGFQVSPKSVDKLIGGDWSNLKGITTCNILTRNLPTHRGHIEMSLLTCSL